MKDFNIPDDVDVESLFQALEIYFPNIIGFCRTSDTNRKKHVSHKISGRYEDLITLLNGDIKWSLGISPDTEIDLGFIPGMVEQAAKLLREDEEPSTVEITIKIGRRKKTPLEKIIDISDRNVESGKI